MFTVPTDHQKMHGEEKSAIRRGFGFLKNFWQNQGMIQSLVNEFNDENSA